MLPRASASAPSNLPAYAAEAAEPAEPAEPAEAAEAAEPAWPGRPALIALAGRRGSPTAREDTPQAAAARSYVTARGAIVAMFGLFLVCDLIADWFGLEVLAGVGFAAGCVLGPYVVRRHALLRVVAAPPAVFLAALVIVQVLTAQGTSRHGKVLSVAEGTLLTLAALAPWLLAGTTLGAVVAIPRGLLECVRELRSELREDLGERRPWVPRLR
jgi:hypothetical protein